MIRPGAAGDVERLREIARAAYTPFVAAIGFALSEITASDATGWFAHCGYNFI